MSTRSIIVLSGAGLNGPEVIRLYKHSDGYPAGNLPIIANALVKAVAIEKAHAKRLKRKVQMKLSGYAGLIIGESVSAYGAGAHIDTDYVDEHTSTPAEYLAKINLAQFGEQSDLEWVYYLDIDKKQLQIFQGFGSPEEILAKGLADPLEDEDRVDTIKKIKTALTEIKKAGFKVNPKNQPKIS